MIDKCKDCKYLDDSNSYPETGFCILYQNYVKWTDNCEDYEED